MEPPHKEVEAQATQAGGKRYNHHRLDVYAVTMEFIRWRHDCLRRLPRRSDLADQLDRASTSIALNIAEACGEGCGADQRRFFRIARRSATECDAALDLIEAARLETPQQLEPGRKLIGRIVAMLTALAPPPGH